MQRRNFLRRAIAGSIALAGAPILLQATTGKLNFPERHGEVDDEAWWNSIRQLFELPSNFINLENGYFSPQPLSTLEYHQQNEFDINKRTSWFMRKEQDDTWIKSKEVLSGFLAVPTSELALTRNTTESMNIIISGYPWKKGDEVIIGNQDYGSMVSAFKQAEKRFKIKVKVAEVPLHPKNDEAVVSAYLNLVTKKTKVLHLTHLINLTGQVIPVAAISREAHKRGIEVMVDAAHSNAQLNFQLPSLEADYVAASLHKWLCCPLGTGYLWMRKEKISNIWPLMGDTDFPKDDIRKFEHQGTRPVHSWATIGQAIDFHNSIGADLFEKRLKYLMNLWCSAVANNKEIQINTPWNVEGRNSAIANVSVNGFTPNELAETLFNKYNIYTVAIDHPAVKGVRITPHIFSKPSDLISLSNALIALAKG